MHAGPSQRDNSVTLLESLQLGSQHHLCCLQQNVMHCLQQNVMHCLLCIGGGAGAYSDQGVATGRAAQGAAGSAVRLCNKLDITT